MASGEFTYGSPDYLGTDTDNYWNQDTGQYLWDSPQPEDQLQNFGLEDNGMDLGTGQSHLSTVTNASAEDEFMTAAHAHPSAHNVEMNTSQKQSSKVAKGVSAAPSVTSEDSSHSSTSERSGRQNRQTSSTSSPPGASGGNSTGNNDVDLPSASIKMETGYDGEDSFQFEESTLPNVGAGIDNLSLSNSLSNAGTTTHSPEFKFNPVPSPDPMSSGMYLPHHMGGLRPMHSAGASPQMTIHPSKMFVIGEETRESSPNTLSMMSSMDDSSGSFLHAQSPLGMGGDNFSGLQSDSTMRGSAYGNNMNFTSLSSTPLPAGHTSHKVPGAQPPTAWPCKLTVEPIPDKSRVETQIPIRLTLHNAAKTITKLHLPSYTISKPKFQAKPPFVKSDDALELSCMLVCASAMQKDGLQDQAFLRAAAEDDNEEKPEDFKMPTPPGQMDENDPMRPLNGGPVQICQGCIVRERKRAARKKTKKADEEEEWAKDEARRVIVFNCPEVRDWCVPGTKETSVKEHDGPIDAMFVNAPMRIACYCRHQSEKVGFQVIFTVRTSDGQILAQAMSESIMITDDHKQPTAGTSTPMPFAGNPQMPSAAMFNPNQGFGMYPTFSQEMPFRTSWSTNDLRTLNQYAPLRRPPTFSRQNSASYAASQAASQASTAASTATATPRNLSRPASPTSPTGHSTKKRRSGVGPPHAKLPAGLSMTRMDNTEPSSAMGAGMNTGNSSAFAFNSPSTPAFSGMNAPFGQTPMATPDPYQSGPPTPMTNAMPSGGFGGNIEDPYQFWSAPTSQHPSRAPSPHSIARQGSFSGSGVPQQAAFALSNLPAGFNLQNPPTIQRLIPSSGPRSGGDEVTILGSGFFQGLDVMFGDKTATNTTFWGDTTIVCRAPPSAASGMVPVIFKHQHRSAPPELQQLQSMMPTRLVPFTYYDDERHQMQALAMKLAAQAQAQANRDLSHMSQEDLARAFVSNQTGFAGFRGGAPPQRRTQQRSASSTTAQTPSGGAGGAGAGTGGT